MSKFFTVIALFVFLILVNSVRAQNCGNEEVFYQNNAYKIRNVKIDTPLKGILGSVEQKIKDLVNAGEMPVKKDQVFNESDLSTAKSFLFKNFPTLNADNSPVAVRISAVALKNCDDNEKKLDIVFLVLVFRPSYYFSRTFELGKKDELKRSTVETKTTKFLQKVTLQPFIAYDRTRNFYGGANIKTELPSNSLFNAAEFDVGGSDSTQVAKAELNGSRDYWKGFLRHQEWRLNYKFSSIPANRAKLQRSIGAFQYYSSTKAITKGQMILRFGGSFEVGNETADVRTNDLSADTIPNSRVSAEKIFVGTSFKIKNQSIKASYGIKLGAARGGKALDFVKHIFDAGAKLDFDPLTADLNFSSGHLNTLGKVPISERFFGGNIERDFIEGSAWQINSNPILRSFSANDFASPDNTNSHGGDSFVAFNSTVSATVWRKRLIPKSAWEDPTNPGQLTEELRTGIDDQFKLAEQTLRDEYSNKPEEFSSFSDNVGQVSQLLAALKPSLENISSTNLGQPNPNPKIKIIMERLFKAAPEKDGRFDYVESRIEEARKGIMGQESAPLSSLFRVLTEDLPNEDDVDSEEEACGELPKGILSYITNLNLCLGKLTRELDQSNADAITRSKDRLENLRASLYGKFQQWEQSPERLSDANRASEELVYPSEVLDYLIRKADLFAVGPAFVFDAVRLKQNGQLQNPWRYGAGGGVKFRFVFLDLTAGYVWNLNRRFGERPGSFLFKVNVIDLLR